MSGPVASRKVEQQRRGRIHRRLTALGYSPYFIEQTLMRVKHHDQLRRARAVVQALGGYP